MIIIDQKGLVGQGSAQSDLHKDIPSWTKSTPKTSQGCGNLVLASPYIASGETPVHAPLPVVERASSIGICLAN